MFLPRKSFVVVFEKTFYSICNISVFKKNFLCML